MTPSLGNRILVLDDEELLGWCICHELGLRGYVVELVATIASGREALRMFRPQLIICDLKFPEGDGLDLLRTRPFACKDTETILMTAYTPPCQTALKELNVRSCLTKPFEMKELMGLVEEHALRQHRL